MVGAYNPNASVPLFPTTYTTNGITNAVRTAANRITQDWLQQNIKFMPFTSISNENNAANLNG